MQSGFISEGDLVLKPWSSMIASPFIDGDTWAEPAHRGFLASLSRDVSAFPVAIGAPFRSLISIWQHALLFRRPFSSLLHKAYGCLLAIEDDDLVMRVLAPSLSSNLLAPILIQLLPLMPLRSLWASFPVP